MMVDNSINRRTMIQLTKIKFMKYNNNYTNQFEFSVTFKILKISVIYEYKL